MDEENKPSVKASGAHLFEWVENKLRPVFGSPPIGRYEAESSVDLKDCPVCERPMREHTIDHSTENTVLNCPVPHQGAWDRDAFEPVNEFGMVMHTDPDRRDTEDGQPGDASSHRPKTHRRNPDV